MNEMLEHMPCDAVVFFKLVAQSVYRDQFNQYGELKYPWPPGFDKCKTDFERIKVAMTLPSLRNFKISEDPDRCASKSDELSNKHREMGNQFWSDKDTKNALQHYNLALFTAKSDGCKALAYGNRSCVLAHLEAYNEVIQDVTRALEHGFPLDRQPKLLFRRAQAFAKLGQFVKAAEEYQHLINLKQLDQIHIDKSLTKILENGLKICKTSKDNQKHGLKPPSFMTQCNEFTVSPEMKDPANENLHNRLQLAMGIRDAVRLQYSDEQMGWNLVITRDVPPGQLLILDKPYTCRITGDHLYSNCYRCFRRSINLIPCRNCSQVGFCSPECEQAAWLPDWSFQSAAKQLSPDPDLPSHRFECGRIHFLRLGDYAGWKIFRNYKPDQLDTEDLKQYKALIETLSENQCIGGPVSTWLSFACLTRTPPWIVNELVKISLDELNVIRDDKQTPNHSLLAFTGKRVAPPKGSHDYQLVSWLISNSERRTLADLWQRTVAAIYLTYCAELMGYPIHRENVDTIGQNLDPNSVLASYAAACILHHLQCVSSNAHSYSSSQFILPTKLDQSHRTNMDLELLQVDCIGSCLYPTLSLANHSCDPNVFHVYLPDAQCGLFALRPLKAGDLVLDNYGFQYGVHPLKSRRAELLSQYCFVCKCEACLNKWPLVFSFNQKCPELIRCSKCHRFATLESASNGSLADANMCQCPLAVQLQTLDEYRRLTESDSFKTVSRIPLKIRNIRYDQLYQNVLDSHISSVAETISAFRRLSGGPNRTIQWLQELFKQIMDLRYGSLHVELDVMEPHSPLS